MVSGSPARGAGARRRRRIAGAAAVLAIWAGVLAWHVKREYFQPLSMRLAEASATLQPDATFYSIRLGDRPIGFASSQIDTVDGGFELRDEIRVHLRALGSEAPARTTTRLRLGRALELHHFDFQLHSGLGDFRVRGRVGEDSMLALDVAAGGDEQSLSIPTEGPVLLSQALPMHFVLGGEPEAGESYTYEIFDPSILDRQRVTLEVIGHDTQLYADSAVFDDEAEAWVPIRYDTVPVWHIRQRFGGVEVESWVDPDGRVMKATSPMGYTIERTVFEIAWNEFRALAGGGAAAGAAASPDIIERTAISADVDLARSADVGELRVRLMNVDLSGFDLHGGRQTLRGDTLSIRAADAPDDAGYDLPADPGEWEDALSATPLIQSDDPRIEGRARAIVDGVTDPVEAARRLNDWVYSRLDKQVTVSVPSAVQVLEGLRGDCNEHTVLYVALARAVGLPTRTAAGLVHLRSRFYYHAWPEVWLGRWVAVDPTLGQFPADASHLRFVTGGLARQVELVRLIGSLELDVLQDVPEPEDM